MLATVATLSIEQRALTRKFGHGLGSPSLDDMVKALRDEAEEVAALPGAA